MLDPHAGEKLTSRGKYEHGAKWSPYDWQKHAHPRIECSQLAQAFQDGIQEYAPELEEAMLPPPQVEGAAPFIADPVIMEEYFPCMQQSRRKNKGAFGWGQIFQWLA